MPVQVRVRDSGLLNDPVDGVPSRKLEITPSVFIEAIALIVLASWSVFAEK